MSAEMRGRIIGRLMKTIDDEAAGDRAATAAAKALISADKLNLDAARDDLADRVRALEEADEFADQGGAARKDPPVPPPG